MLVPRIVTRVDILPRIADGVQEDRDSRDELAPVWFSFRQGQQTKIAVACMVWFIENGSLCLGVAG